ncbi:MAG: alkaline phosphatase [Sedimentisphaerales bacterium]|nr:alkaline phosphatase [Sedimentisphaerales bacterium]
MQRRHLLLFSVGLMFVVSWLVGCSEPISHDLPAVKNVILFIGDGMGFEQVKAAGMFAHGRAGTLAFEAFPYRAQMTTFSADNAITDSSASGTAMATGHKVNNGVVGMAIPGDKRELPTLVEICKEAGKSTALVTTTYITHATPATFGAHEESRKNYEEIAEDYLLRSRPDVLFGSAKYISPEAAKKAGYFVVINRKELFELDTENIEKVSGQFGEDIPYEYDGVGDLPHLSEMTEVALKMCDNNPRGFFMMVEGGKIDWAGHDNDLIRNVTETVEFDRAVQKALDWAGTRNDTLIVVTADHETGGMTVLKNNGQGKIPTVWWSTGGHTARPVAVYATGNGAEEFTGQMDNTGIFEKIMAAMGSVALTTTQ